MKRPRPLDAFVMPRGSYRLNLSVARFGDRRTKRNRDRSSGNRNAIDRSRREQ